MGKGVLLIYFLQRGGVDLKGKTFFRESMDINFSETKGGKMILCFLRCMMENSKQILQS